jgi:hypothetical protein
MAFRFLEVTLRALGHRPLLAKLHTSHLGPTGRQITCFACHELNCLGEDR